MSIDKQRLFERAVRKAGIPSWLAELYDAEIVTRGPFSFCAVIATKRDGVTGPPVVVSGYGFSKCSPKDKFNPDIGYAIALSRAATDAAKKLAKELGIGQNKEGK